jgi:WD40 repeat protein
VVATLPGFIWRVLLAPDGRRIYASGVDGSVACWESESCRLLFTGKHPNPVPALALSRDGALLFSGGTEGTAQCWDVANGNLVRTLQLDDQCWDVATSPTADLAAVSGGILRLWNYRTDEVVAQWPTREGPQAFLPDGQAFFLSDMKFLRLLPVAPEQPPRVFDSSLGWVRRVVVSANGRHAASGHGNAGNTQAQLNDDYSVRLWDVKEGRLLARFGDFKHSIWGLAFTPDSRRLFAVSLDGSIRLFEVEGLKEIWRMEHLVGLYDIDVSNDGQFALTGDAHGQVRLWRIREVE